MSTDLRKERLKYQPRVAALLKQPELLEPIREQKELSEISSEITGHFPHLKGAQPLHFKSFAPMPCKPLKVGIVLSGGPASGGHNVIAGVFDALKKFNPQSQLIGFLGGPSGIIENHFLALDAKKIDLYRNMGGFDLLGSGRTKIESDEQFTKSLETVSKHALDGLVIVGGDDSNTNAAVLAEYFLAHGNATTVVGVPKTIDGDLKNEWVETSFGFDSATKTYSEIIGNLARDAASQGKYYFFIKVMGRTASHLVLECALKTHPNLSLIGEEIEAAQSSLNDIVKGMCDLIVQRAEHGKHHGVILIPEGIIEFIPEFTNLIKEINAALITASPDAVVSHLTEQAKKLFSELPVDIQKQLLLDRDPHGNIQVSKIDTERLFIELVTEELCKRSDYKGKLSPHPLFCGYEGRSCYPSNFDANYCYNLGLTAALLIKHHRTGYMAVIENLAKPVAEWIPIGVPLIKMIHLQVRKGKHMPVIQKGLVDLQGAPFKEFVKLRDKWRLSDDYQEPGPIQYFGPEPLTDITTKTLQLEQQ